MSSLFRMNFLRTQAETAERIGNQAKNNIQATINYVTSLREIQDQWHGGDDEIDEQDLSTIDAFFTTMKPLAEQLLNKICEAIQTDEEPEQEENET